MQKETHPLDLDGQQQERAKAERVQQERREREIADFKWLMGEERFRRFIWRLMREGRVFHNPSGSNELFELGRQVGQRDQGLKLVNELIEHCPEKWIELLNDQTRT